MDTRTQRTIAIVLVVIVVLLGLGALAISRGALTFENGLPRLNAKALTQKGQPSLERPIKYPTDFPEEAKAQYEENRQKSIETVQSDPTRAAAWFDLAILYRMVNDHEGALEIWEYVSQMYPEDGISLHNIAEYYFHTEKDYEKAEEYYQRSIEKEPQLAQNYTDLFEMYRYVYKTGTNAAADILQQGKQQVTRGEQADFALFLATYYEEKGKKEDARTAYQEARAIALELKNNNLVRRIDQLLADLD